MFSYSSLSASVEEKLKCLLYPDYVKVVYNDPDPILLDQELYPVTVPAGFRALDKAIKEFQVRNDDIWILSFPKTGTTWTVELVTTLQNGVDAVQDEISKRCPLIEYLRYEKYLSIKLI